MRYVKIISTNFEAWVIEVKGSYTEIQQMFRPGAKVKSPSNEWVTIKDIKIL